MLQQSPGITQKKLMMIRKHRMEEKLRTLGNGEEKFFLALKERCVSG